MSVVKLHPLEILNYKSSTFQPAPARPFPCGVPLRPLSRFPAIPSRSFLECTSLVRPRLPSAGQTPPQDQLNLPAFSGLQTLPDPYRLPCRPLLLSRNFVMPFFLTAEKFKLTAEHISERLS
jgi:hypothetical protein